MAGKRERERVKQWFITMRHGLSFSKQLCCFWIRFRRFEVFDQTWHQIRCHGIVFVHLLTVGNQWRQRLRNRKSQKFEFMLKEKEKGDAHVNFTAWIQHQRQAICGRDRGRRIKRSVNFHSTDNPTSEPLIRFTYTACSCKCHALQDSSSSNFTDSLCCEEGSLPAFGASFPHRCSRSFPALWNPGAELPMCEPFWHVWRTVFNENKTEEENMWRKFRSSPRNPSHWHGQSQRTMFAPLLLMLSFATNCDAMCRHNSTCSFRVTQRQWMTITKNDLFDSRYLLTNRGQFSKCIVCWWGIDCFKHGVQFNAITRREVVFVFLWMG